MTLQDSPSLEEYKEGYQPPVDPEKGKRRTRIILAIIAVLAVILGIVNFLQSDQAEILARKGSISGFAVDESDNPIPVEVLIFGTDIKVMSADNGYFEVDNIPAGDQSVIVAYDIIAAEVNVTVTAGQVTDIGTVVVPLEELEYLLEE